MKKSKRIKQLEEEAKVDKTAYIPLGDAYEEEGDLQNAAKARSKCRLSQIKYRVLCKKTHKIIDEFNTLGSCSASLNALQSLENPYDKYEIHMYELRYVDLGVIVSPSQKDREQIKLINGHPHMKEVDLYEFYRKHWHIAYDTRRRDMTIALRQHGLSEKQAKIAYEYIYKNYYLFEDLD